MTRSRVKIFCEVFLIVVQSVIVLAGASKEIVRPSRNDTTKGTVPLKANSVDCSDLNQDERSQNNGRRIHNVEPFHDDTVRSRQLSQRSSFQGNRNEFGGSLDCSEIEEFLNISTRTWNVNDDLWRKLNNDTQAIVNCSAENDIILFSTSILLQPSSSIIIWWNITLGARKGDSFVEDGAIVETSFKAKLKCPEQGDLFVLRGGNVTISNIVFTDCERHGSIIKLDYKCESDQEKAHVQLRNVEFHDNLLHEHYWIVAANNPNCVQLTMDHVVLSGNQCNRRGCVALASVNHISNVHIVENLVDIRLTSATAVFLASESSHTTAVNISALRNEIRIFRLKETTLFISASQFRNNTAASSPFEQHEALGGSGVLADLSSVTIADSLFEGSTGTNGSALYASASQMKMTNCEFRHNRASYGGGAVFALKESSLDFISCNFSRNFASHGACIHIQQKSKLRMELSSVEANHASSYGGAISVDHSVADFSTLTFLRNKAETDGSVLTGNHSNISFAGVSFICNEARSAGTIHLSRSSAVFNNVKLQDNVAGSHGGGIFSSNSTVRIGQSSFLNNRGVDGGSIGVRSRSWLQVINSTFCNSSVKHWGGAVYADQSSRVVLKALAFSNNTADYRGGACYFTRTGVRMTNVTFNKNNTANKGGALFGHSGSLTVSQSTFAQNKANDGGGLFLRDLDGVNFDLVSLERNSASNAGGAGVLVNSGGTISFSRCIFSRNEAGDGGGVYLDGSNITIRQSVLFSNKAKDNAGAGAANKSRFKITNTIVASNIAVEQGGGIGVQSGSSIFCQFCVLTNNVARNGAGLYADSDDSIPIVVHFHNSTLEGNNASEYGGGVHFNRPMQSAIECSNFTFACGRLLLSNTDFVGNYATFNGSAIFTTNGEGVFASCANVQDIHDVLNRTQLADFLARNPGTSCDWWRRNLCLSNHRDGVYAVYRLKMSFSMDPNRDFEIQGDVNSTFVLINRRTRTRLPPIKMVALDSFGQPALHSLPNLIEVQLSADAEYLRGTRQEVLRYGKGTFEDLPGFQNSSECNFTIRSTLQTLEQTLVKLRAISCRIGEEITVGQLCQECDSFSYSFDGSKRGGCTACPKDATCEDRYIVPKPGYWHKSPCHKNVQRCLNDKACHEEERKSELADFTANFTDCNMTDEDRTAYGKTLCRKGYRGPLCVSCQSGYGLSLSFLCLKCPSVIESLSTILCLVLYLLIMASFTIRGSLPKIPVLGKTVSSSSLSSGISGNSSRSVIVNIQVAKATRNGNLTPPRAGQSQSQVSTSKASNSPQTDVETTKWETTEIFKILINSLQVTAIAAGIQVHWSEAMIEMFEASEYVGALTSVAVSRPIDCIIGTDSSAMRSVWRTLLSLFVPGAVLILFAFFWACVALYNKKTGSYFWKRTLLSATAITYISYLGLTKYAVRAFYCVEVYDSEDPFSDSKSKYWAVDTSIHCYTRNHLGLIAIAVIVLVFISIAFPFISAIVLSRDKVQYQQNPGWTFEVMGFLYRAFKERFVFWESVVMLRKGFLSVIVVFAYPLGGESQGLLAIIVLVLSLFAHLRCSPYREEFNRLNSYEAGSLLVSCLTFVLGQFFGVDKSVEFIRRLASFIIISMNVSFFLFLVSVLLLSWLEHCKAVLISEGAQIDANAPPLKVLKVFLAAKASSCCQSS